MKRVITIIIAATTLLAACSKNASFVDTSDNNGVGNIEIKIVDAASTRADHDHSDENRIDLKAIYSDWPDYSDDYWMTNAKVQIANLEKTAEISGKQTYASYKSINDFNAAKVRLAAGDDFTYVVRAGVITVSSEMYDYVNVESGADVKWYDALYSTERLAPKTPEGMRMPYFEGTASGVKVAPNGTTQVNLTLTIANSAVAFNFTEAFKKYFSEAHLKLTTGSGAVWEFGYDASGATNLNTPYWINPRSFTISGTVKRQAAGSNLEAAEEAFETIKVANDDVLPQHYYTYNFDMKNVGNTTDNSPDYAGIKITIDEKWVDGGRTDVELNPDASK